MDRKCKNNPDRFCYICGNVVLPNRQEKITDFVKKSCRDYFGVRLKDQDKSFASYVCCKTSVKNLRDWRNGKKKRMPFAIPKPWRKGKDRITDCYFCMINPEGLNRKNKHHAQYSTIRPIPHGPDLLVPEPDNKMEHSFNCEHSDMTVVAGDGAYNPEKENQLVPLTQAQLNDLTRDLNLSKESA